MTIDFQLEERNLRWAASYAECMEEDAMPAHLASVVGYPPPGRTPSFQISFLSTW